MNKHFLVIGALCAVLALSTGCSKRETEMPVESAQTLEPIGMGYEITDDTDSELMSMAEFLGEDILPDTEDIPVLAEDEVSPSFETQAPAIVSSGISAPNENGLFVETIEGGEGQQSDEVFAQTVQKNYSFATLTDPSFGFLLNYPADWVNLPGKYTVCYEDPNPTTSFPARVAVTRKTLAHKPKATAVYTQFQSYAQIIYEQYDPKTFEYSDVNSQATFMNHQAYEVTYLAYKDDVEVEGYMCCCAINKSVYVFHFCAPYDEYDSFSSTMVRIRDSVTSLEDDE
ncbi:MAG: hypothetical protein IJ074_10405 [Clostridia bacterium]|nr:hypothetical protein [Clostridia bacterium]